MRHKAVGTSLVISGLLIVAASLLVDVVGLGGEYGIGWKQTTGVIVGILIGATGLITRSGTAPRHE